MYTAYAAYQYFLIAVLGACIGSFVNVVVYRLPKSIPFKTGRSFCPSCKKNLKRADIIPVFSYVLLRGRCRYCGVKIPIRYPLVEIGCAILAMLCFSIFDIMRFPPVFCVSVILLTIALIDIDCMEIPDTLVLSLVPFAIAALWVFKDVSLVERVIGFFAVSLPMLLLALIIPGAFGGGDIKLMAVCGFLLGWKSLLLAFFIANITGGGAGIYLLASGNSKRGAHIAFGPYLCAGVFISLLWGNILIEGYMRLFI